MSNFKCPMPSWGNEQLSPVKHSGTMGVLDVEKAETPSSPEPTSVKAASKPSKSALKTLDS